MGACKEPEGIGLDVLPDGEHMAIAWIDTFTLEAKTVLYDSVPASGLNTYVIGDYGDPLFGRVQSSLFTQFELGGTSLDFDGAVVDSVILNLPYSGSYGSTDKIKGNMTFGVYEIEQELFDSSYYSNASIPALTMPALAEHTFRPDLFSNVSVAYDTTLLPPSLRIPLDASFGQRLFDSPNLASQDQFLTEFQGIGIVPIDMSVSPDHGSILYFNLLTRSSRIEVYYEDTVYNFEIDSRNENAEFVHFSHEFSPEVNSALADGTVTGATRLYVQSMAGVRAQVNLPHLRELNELGIVSINKAELVVPVDESFPQDQSYPSRLYALGVDSAGVATNIVDLNDENPDYYGGVYDSDKQQYVFNIARHIQSILSNPDENDFGLYILNAGTSTTANRVILNGPEHATKPMELRMTYTIIE